MKVAIDINAPYEVYMSKNEYDEDEHNQMIKQVVKVCNADITSDELSSLDISSIPIINNYLLMINFDMSEVDSDIKEEHFESIKVNIDNKEYQVNVGNVKLVYEEIEQFADYDEGEGVSGQTGGAFGFPIDPANLYDNTFEYSGFMFNTVKDIEITDIGILDDSTLTMKDTVIQVSGDISMGIEF